MTKISIKTVCSLCGKEQVIKVFEKDYRRWKNGELIQRCFPYLTANERESLKGICGECFDKLFSDE